MRRSFLLARLSVLACLALAPAADAAERKVPVHIEVTGARSVAERDVLTMEQALAVEFVTEKRCPAVLVERKDDARILVRLHLDRWLDRVTPDGVWQDDPRTGRYMPGMQYEFWVVYDVDVRAVGEDEPIFHDEDSNFRSVDRAGRNPLHNPRIEALEEAHERISSRILRKVCRHARRVVDD